MIKQKYDAKWNIKSRPQAFGTLKIVLQECNLDFVLAHFTNGESTVPLVKCERTCRFQQQRIYHMTNIVTNNVAYADLPNWRMTIMRYC